METVIKKRSGSIIIVGKRKRMVKDLYTLILQITIRESSGWISFSEEVLIILKFIRKFLMNFIKKTCFHKEIVNYIM